MRKEKMEGSRDFIHWLGEDLSIKIFTCLEDPSDLKRVSLVSSSWRHFVIMNGLFKKLCVKMFPETSRFAGISEKGRVDQPVETGTGDSCESLYLKMEHRAFVSLINELTAFTGKKCISDALFASSTDNYPTESVINTLEPSDRVDNRASYWSSKGDIDPTAPETLIFKLASRLCLISEVCVHPFQAYFQFGLPIYSANAVRFHFGHPKVQMELENDDGEELLDVRKFSEDMFVWTYTSPEFPMSQENCLQKFKLPKPVLCIGGILKVELLGRVQTQEIDRLYYICISHVQAIGRSLSTLAFDVEMLEENGMCKLIHYPELDYHFRPAESPSNISPSRFHRFSASLRSWELMILNTLRRNGHALINDDDNEE